MSESADGVSRSATRQTGNGTDTLSSFRPLPATLNGSRISVANDTEAPGRTSEATSEHAPGAAADTGTWIWTTIADAPNADTSVPIASGPMRTATSSKGVSETRRSKHEK